jgi:uncharacterized protein (TIGR03437 family)
MSRPAICVLVTCLGFCSQASGQSGIITTVAGNGAEGFSGDGGRATAASLNYPIGIALDASGNLFIVDGDNHRIRKVSASGIITTVAGNGAQSFAGDGGAATAASLNYPDGIAVDASGNLFIADSGNYRVRKVSASGVITTIAGNGNSGFSGDGGPATAASLNFPWGIAVDASGNLFVADITNNRIRKVSAGGIITTVAGGGTGGLGDGGQATAASLSGPLGVAVDATGNLFIADSGNYRIRKVSASGIITTVAGNEDYGFSGDGGPATAAFLDYPDALAVDASGNLFIADTDNYRIRKVSAGGIITTVAGNGDYVFYGDGGPATAASLAEPTDVAVDAYGNLFIVDRDNQRIREVIQSSPSPLIGLSPSSLTFSAAAGGTNPASQTVSISNLGSGTLPWTATANTTSGGNWLNVSPTSGTNGGTMTVSASITGLVAGTYNGSIPAAATGASNSPQTIAVTLMVGPAPGPSVLASLSPSSATAGGAAFTLTVSGTGFFPSSTSLQGPVPGSVVQWNGAALTTGFVSTTLLTAAVPASDLASPGTAQVTAVNPGGFTSNVLVFTIQQGPAPGSAGFTATGSMTVARNLPTATMLNTGKVLVSGADVNGGLAVLASAELYDPATGTFSATGSMITGRYYHTATLLDNGQVLVAGGYDSSDTGLASAELYDPAKGTFSATGSMTTARSQHTATLLGNGKVLITGGTADTYNDNYAESYSAELYDPATGTFSATGSMATGRYSHTATLLNNGQVLVAGSYVASASAELYNPATGTFSVTGSMTTPRGDHTATLLNDGQVLVAGGFNGQYVFGPNGSGGLTVVASAELYDPGTGTFTATGSMTTPRVYHTATPLNGGQVLMAGGSGDSSAELYDPAKGTFSATGSMTTVRVWNTATWLNDGQALVAGGFNGSDLASAELYHPAGSLPIITGPTITAVSNAATHTPGVIAPNSWVEIKGSNLAPAGDSRIWQGSDFVNGQMPTQLDGVGVTMNGENAYVYYISPAQVNVLTPPDLASGPVQVNVTTGGATSAAYTAQAQEYLLSFFLFGAGPYVLGTHATNGSDLGPTSLYPGLTTPATPGELVILYATGFGPISPPVAAGSEVQSGSLPALPLVQIGGIPASVLFAGLASPGLYQFNVVVPASAPNGDNTLTAQYNGLTTQSGVLLTVQNANSGVNPTPTITTAGSGGGTVSSSPGGTSCGPNCPSFAAGTTVTPTATPNTGSTFTGWIGACFGTPGCTVTMNSNLAVTAWFNPMSSAGNGITMSSVSPAPRTPSTVLRIGTSGAGAADPATLQFPAVIRF